MINILIVTHEDVGKSLLKSTELIVGKQSGIEALSLERGDEIHDLRKKIQDILNNLTGEDEILILTDLFGGSPCNAVISNSDKYHFKCLAGVNLPMILEAVLLREKNNITIETLTKKCKKAAIEGIQDIQIPFQT